MRHEKVLQQLHIPVGRRKRPHRVPSRRIVLYANEQSFIAGAVEAEGSLDGDHLQKGTEGDPECERSIYMLHRAR